MTNTCTLHTRSIGAATDGRSKRIYQSQSGLAQAVISIGTKIHPSIFIKLQQPHLLAEGHETITHL